MAFLWDSATDDSETGDSTTVADSDDTSTTDTGESDGGEVSSSGDPGTVSASGYIVPRLSVIDIKDKVKEKNPEGIIAHKEQVREICP